jgi:hypothetical protein
MALVLKLPTPTTSQAVSVAPTPTQPERPEQIAATVPTAIAEAAFELKPQPQPQPKEQQPEISLASQQIVERLASMQSELLQANPEITNDLHFIHRAILADPSQITMLTEEQKIIFFAGLMQKTGAEIIATVSKSKQASSKKLAALSVDDLL